MYEIISAITKKLSSIEFTKIIKVFKKKSYSLTTKQRNEIRGLVAKDYYIILTCTNSHLSTYLIKILSFIKTRKWPTYTHALMNVDNEVKIGRWKSFMFMEATNAGVHWSSFNNVFNCDKVCLLKPKNLTIDEQTKVIDKMLTQHGKKYDNLFDLADESRLSCVELVRIALQADPDYAKDFSELEKQISKVGNLTPQMYRDCEDFEVVIEYK